jgi:capsular exopolysaccharide synthesis family protein
MPDQPVQTIDVMALLRAVWRRKWLLIVPIVVAGGAGFGVAQTLAPVYEARSTIVVKVQERFSEGLAQIIGRSPAEEQLSRVQEKLKSRAFLVELVRSLDLAEDPGIKAWAEETYAEDPAIPVQDLAEGAAVEGLRRRISVHRSSTDGFQVVIRDTDPDRATLLAQHITNAFVSASNREQLEEIRAVYDFSIEQLVIYRQKLDDAELRLKDYRESQAVGYSMANPVNSTNVGRVDILISQATVERDRAGERVNEKRNDLMGLAGNSYNRLSVLESDLLTSYSEQLVELEREVASVLVLSAQEGPEITTLYVSEAEKKDQYRQEARRLAAAAVPGAAPDILEAFAQYRIAQVEEQMISERASVLGRFMRDYTRGRASAAGSQLEITRLEQEVESTRALYEAFLQQTAAGQITEALEAARAGGRFEIIEPPVRPTSPVAPDKLMILVMSVFGGAVVGLAAILVSEQGDTSFKNIDEIEAAVGVPVLATIPSSDVLRGISAREKKAAKKVRKKGAGPSNGDSELLRHMVRETAVSFEFRRMARRIARGVGRDIPKSILVTSANRGEGKSTAAASLAITLAKHYGHRTVLVDCDLRKPRAHRLMAVASKPGLSDALERGNLLGTDIKPTKLPNLFVLPCGTRRDQPTWLLESMPGSRVMAELLASFDTVILDTAPNLPVPDAMILGGEVDGVVIVLRAGVTPREVVTRGVQLQRDEKENVLGVVVNNLERVLPYYYDYRYYGYTSDSSELEEEEE